ncbi:MAG: DAK2 domain-containing protein, partial [Proteobacteria bacterium]|nr:DAK2 domain-containing protein [Pseudomonadota bacterium]
MGSAAGNYLYGDVLANALVSGIYRVINDQDFLNKINVFPVADGDTGTNLSLSLGAALTFLNSPQEQHLGTLLAVFADTLLDSARGNSGAIVAQFFQGMSDSAGNLTRFTTVTFSTAVSHGSDYAHTALSDPQDGTILSVISALKESIASQLAQDQDADLSTVLHDAMPRVEIALANTTQQLDVLRKAGVVDAGAKGFFELFKGMSDYINYGTVVDEPDLTAIHSNARDVAIIESGENCEYRYCTECIVTGTDIDRRKLREALAALGESLVLAGTKRKAKIHIHVNEPGTVFAVSRQYGVVSAEKVDDM